VLDSAALPRQDQLGKDRFLVAIAARPRRKTRAFAVGMAAVVAVAAAVALWLGRKPAVLEYQVTGPLTTQGEWLGVLPDKGTAELRFSEGTEIELGPGSKGRVAEVTPEGASIVLGAGRLHARVVRRAKSRWVVAAGPYSIEVTGTAFDVGWTDKGERLEVRLHDGSVIPRRRTTARQRRSWARRRRWRPRSPARAARHPSPRQRRARRAGPSWWPAANSAECSKPPAPAASTRRSRADRWRTWQRSRTLLATPASSGSRAAVCSR
jgi:ferric-dicitrate binding protein FerR (iron transport regulator)